MLPAPPGVPELCLNHDPVVIVHFALAGDHRDSGARRTDQAVERAVVAVPAEQRPDYRGRIQSG